MMKIHYEIFISIRKFLVVFANAIFLFLKEEIRDLKNPQLRVSFVKIIV